MVFNQSFRSEEGHPDILLLSGDQVLFHAHQRRLLQSSQNNFRGTLPLIPTPNITPSIAFLEHSDVLNILLHAVYDIPCQPLRPKLESLLTSIEALKTFGIPLSEHIKPSKPLFQHILTQMPSRPMDVFIFAAENNLEELAASSSSYLLSYDLSKISDTMAERIGPIYLKRLYLLHFCRSKILKTLFFEPPKQHTPTLTCSRENQEELRGAWNLACFAFAWEGAPGIVYEDR